MLTKYYFFFVTLFFINSTQAQIKYIFNNNFSFSVPAGWYIKDSSDKRILLRKNDDLYSKIELKIYDHKSKDLTQYIALDRKKLSPDKHIRTVLPDLNVNTKIYKKIKYFNTNKIVIANTEIEHVTLFKPKFPIPKITNGRLEIIVTCSKAQEADFTKTLTQFLTNLK